MTSKLIQKMKDNPKYESIAWQPILDKKGKPVLDYKGEPMFKSVPVPRKGENIIFCPHCDKYKEIEVFDLGYGAMEKGCKECRLTLRDFDIKRVNPFLK